MVDAADHDKIEASRNEFHNLLDKTQLAGIPVLVLANKRDVAGAMDEREVIDKMYVLAIFDFLYFTSCFKVLLCCSLYFL